jgi:[ribosomal protein S5]-alanine N-acetyltransferase
VAPGAPLRHPEPPPTDGVVTLRAWRADDLAAIAAFGLDEDNVRFGDVAPGRREEDAAAYLATMERRRREGSGLGFAVADARDDAVLGTFDIRLPQRGVGEIGYLLDPAARGHGTMTRAARLAVAWSFDALGLVRVQAFVSPDNAPSMRLLERLGFACEGLLRSYRGPGADRLAYAVLRGELR